MYVRTKKGEIFDCYESEQMHKPIYYPKKSKTNGYIDYEDVYKKSDNIIDILEVGDYVNGLKVEGVNNEIKGFGTIIFSKDSSIMEDYIYSIVTKEMFANAEYRVETN